ncbi:MAG: outer membrane protein transport protein [Desulfobulbaceae bacterium]|jgi:long-chain fatty acid transport protein|nr:outer membrane protein transport protein [Desulfobulbaceae bacterium]
MKKILSVTAVVSLLTTMASGGALASGYRIPEQSLNSTAKSGANIASASSADAAYFNPAAVVWLKEGWLAEINGTYLHLTAMDYTDRRSPLYNAESKDENYFIPTIFLVSPEWKDFRFGFSVTVPYGLGKRWYDPLPKTFAEKFDLRVFDINPTVTYAINDKFAISGGIRALYAKATVMSNGMLSPEMGVSGSRYMHGDTTEWGYNLAIDYKPAKDWNLAATYRSHVDLDYKGDVILKSNMGGGIDTSGNVTVVAPAVLALSAAYTWDKLTVELTIDRTFWSEYEHLDFDYDQPVMNPVLAAAFERPVKKDWDDSSAIRLGFDYALTNTFNIMAGFAYDENPVPEETVNFELPDSDAWLFSLGMRYAVNDNLDIGVAALVDVKEDRKVKNQHIDGEFTDCAAVLLTFGVQYRF